MRGQSSQLSFGPVTFPCKSEDSPDYFLKETVPSARRLWKRNLKVLREQV